MKNKSLLNTLFLFSSSTFLVISIMVKEAIASTNLFFGKDVTIAHTRIQPSPQKLSQSTGDINQTYLLVKLSERRVYFYQDGKQQVSYPIAIGKRGWETPTGEFKVIKMLRNPPWQNLFTAEVVPASSENPLGVAWIGFLNKTTSELGFHGTPDEKLVGQAVSHGCIRMRNQDILKLYEKVNLGMTVKVVP